MALARVTRMLSHRSETPPILTFHSMDAISFVLGIKSSHLRSSHLRDLVYRGRVLKHSTINDDGSAKEANGTQDSLDATRNDPKTAWVMAVYQDDAGDEQHWKRSITSQGTSEYRINNRIVTAQEYNDALEEENILIKARNFLVFQGDVEAIAAQSPKDLTRLIEQISGSLEFKAEYERLKAEQEEANETQNFQLNRRRGINSEIKQYQEQKREADNYARKAEERDEAVIRHISWKLFHFQRQIEESTAEIQKHQEELKEYRRGVQKYEDNLEAAKKDHAKVGRDVGKVEKRIKETEREIEEKTNSLVPVDEKIEISSQKLSRYAARVNEISTERDSQQGNVAKLERDLKTVEKAQALWESEWEKASSKKGGQLSQDDIARYSRLKEEVSKRSSENQIKVDNLRRQRKADTETVNSLKSKVDSNEYQLKIAEGELSSMKDRKASTKKLIDETTRDINSKKTELNNLTSERLRVSQSRTELEEKLQEVLKKLIDADDGRQQNEKELRTKEMISTLRRIFPGVKGRVSDLCKPKQKKYADAVSTVLGRNFDSIVVDTEKTAKECIDHLRDQRSGQATFIPLETIQVKAVSSNLKGMHRGMRPAIETVDFDNSVARAITYACGNAIVCDDLATAKYLCYEKGVDAKAVTLDGTVIHKGGLMTGGRGPGQQNTRRWEETEVDNLRRLKDKLAADLAALPKGHRRGADEESLLAELAGLEQRLVYSKEELKAFDKNIKSKESEVKHFRGQLAEVKPKYKEKQAALEELDVRIQELQEKVSGVEDEVFGDFCRQHGYDDIRQYEAQQGSLQQEAAQKKLEFTTQKSRIENQLSFERQRLQATNDRIASLQTQEKRDKDLIAKFEEEREAIQEELDVLGARMEELEESLNKQKERFARSGETLTERRRELQKRSKDVEATLSAINALEGEVQRSSSSRYALLRRCKLEDIAVPLTDESESLDQLPIDDLVQAEPDPDAMDVDEGNGATQDGGLEIKDYGIIPDFSALDDDLKEVRQLFSMFTRTETDFKQESSEALDSSLQEKIRNVSNELEKMAPNMRAMERLEGTETKLRSVEKDFEEARRRARRARDDFEDVMLQRSEAFNKAFNHISEQIGVIYRDLTKSKDYPLGGQAYVSSSL